MLDVELWPSQPCFSARSSFSPTMHTCDHATAARRAASGRIAVALNGELGGKANSVRPGDPAERGIHCAGGAVHQSTVVTANPLHYRASPVSGARPPPLIPTAGQTGPR
ncbi:hypothetical protein SKAU_G00364730 [Synaphobranchus kaupii]|uniref:Uncharacterized protein n=1 Tax=Synaphobranchus kaupii TaxID=118154 RepID=A0A9Q1EEU0_SYNKA|nr:hypothetical protein SKAU_G00364730 [Synaphobranchus kaupii]